MAMLTNKQDNYKHPPTQTPSSRQQHLCRLVMQDALGTNVDKAHFILDFWFLVFGSWV